MKQYALEQIRNIALAGHGGSGKTTLAEHVLYMAGHIDRIGTTEAGNTTSDFDPEEQRRKISLSTTLLPIEWNGHKLNLLDTPGFPDFIGELYSALQVVDAVVLVTPAQAELEVGFENAWEICEARKLPRIIFVNKMERDGADYRGLVNHLRSIYGKRIVPLQVPIGAETQFKGVVDVLHGKAYMGKDRDVEASPIPNDLHELVGRARELLMEAAAETDDDLLVKYLDGNPLTDEELVHAFHEGVRQGDIVPVLCGSAALGEGLAPLLQTIVELAPSPAEAPAPIATDLRKEEPIELKPDPSAPFAAFVFKTTADPFVGKLTYFRVYSGTLKGDTQIYNAQKERDERIGQVFYLRGKNQIATSEVRAGDIGVVAKLQETGTGHTLCDKSRPIAIEPAQLPEPIYTIAVVAKTKADEDRLGTALARLHEEDPTFHARRDPETGQTLLSGMGDLHLEVIIDKLKRKFNTEVETIELRIPYRETITRPVQRVEGKFKRQSGGRGQYGHCFINMEPLPRGSGIEFTESIVGGAIPKNYLPAIEKGIREAAEKGIQAGFPAVDFKVNVIDGSYHEVDSSDQAFRIAGSLAYQEAAMKAGPVVLEPILEVEVDVPESFTGDVMGDLNGRRGRIAGIESLGNGRQLIRANVPMSEMTRYALELRSITRGRGRFRTRFSHYEEAPPNVAQPLIEKHKRERESHEH
ncbi:MAG: elongation factor G [Fimbriimonadales bacterium]|nr:MAG: elongation factor G [Fimbriimonadales bacterium]GIV11653.1 MAG: elongation factor G [Fimbriimonadales bacterium]